MLVERTDLLRSLRQHRDEAATGRGSLVLVAGEAGAGKTTLVQELIDALGSATDAIVGACDPLSTPRPLGPLRDFVTAPASGLAELRLDDADPVDLFGKVLDRLIQPPRPVVMVIEDLHWADEATLDFVRFLGRRVRDTKAVLVCTYRDDEIGGNHPVRAVLGQLSSLGSTHRVVVPPLSVDAVVEISGLPRHEAERLHERTAGNAFFVTEVVAADIDLPASVQDAVLARLARLGEPERTAVRVVSVAPRSLEIARAMTLAEVPADVIDGAVASGVLQSDGSRLRFRHELARDAVEASLPPAMRLELHRRMISLLEAEGEHDVSRLAHHAVRADGPDLIARYGPEAARDAIERGARREAIGWYRATQAHEGALEPRAAAELWLALGSELIWIMEEAASADALTRSIELFRELDDVEGRARALIALHYPLAVIEGPASGLACIDEALAILEPRGPSKALALALVRIAHNQMVDRQREPARATLARAHRVVEQIDDVDMAWRLEMLAGTVEIVMGDPGLGVTMLQASLRTAENMNAHHFVSAALGMLGSGGGEARRYHAAIDALERGVTYGLAIDDDQAVAYDLAWLARIAFEQCRWDEAVDHAERALAYPQGDGIHAVTAQSVVGRVRVRRGDPGGAEMLADVTGQADDFLFQYVWNAYCGTAEHAWLQGAGDTAAPLLRHAFERAMASDSPWGRGEVGFWMWRIGEIDQPPHGAAEPFAAQILGDWQSAADQWREIGCPYEEAMAFADGDEPALRKAIDILDRLGAVPAARLVRGRLRKAGADTIPRGPTRSTLANPAQLTRRQLEVLELISEGLSNAEIADRLFVAKKTVEHHVSAIYSKLAVDTRTQAVAVARQRSIIEM